MKKSAALFAFIAIALIGLVAYILLIGRESDVLLSEPADETPSTETATIRPATAKSPPPPEIAEAEPPAALIDEVPTQKYAAAEDAVGYRGEFRSVEYDTYLVMMVLGDASEVIDAAGTLKDRLWIKSVQQEYDLTDDEIEKFTAYSRKSLEADRKFQAELQGEICAKRDSFNNLYEFGNAINEFSRKAIDNQESMGRRAEPELGSVLFSKIISRVRSKPREMSARVDFASLLTARNEGLDVEIERVCPSRE